MAKIVPQNVQKYVLLIRSKKILDKDFLFPFLSCFPFLKKNKNQMTKAFSNFQI